MNTIRRHRHALACTAFLVAVVPAMSAPAPVGSRPADAAAVKAIMPPPGLYKVEIDGKEKDAAMDGLAYTRQLHIDPDSGAMTQRFQDRAGKSASQQYAGQGPATVCFTAHKLTASPFAANCKVESSAVANGEWHAASQCGDDHIAVAVRKTGPTTWEYRTTILSADTVSGPAGAASGMAAMPRGALQNLAQKGPTAGIRAEAARALAEQSARPAGAAPAAVGGARQEITSTQTLTRIADACTTNAR
jgi:hypothetical protein